MGFIGANGAGKTTTIKHIKYDKRIWRNKVFDLDNIRGRKYQGANWCSI